MNKQPGHLNAVSQVNHGVSVIICCFNSEDRITSALQHLSVQKLTPGLNAEIVLVNNRSTDNTVSVARKFWDSTARNMSLRIVDEPEQGLSYARIKGLREARFETVIYCDDDNHLSENFLQSASNRMQTHPEAAILGGPIDGVFEKPLPAWLKQPGFYAVGTMDADGDITKQKPFVPGAGMVVRRSSFVKLIDSGFTFFCTDRRGTSLSSGGDTEFCYALVLGGGRVFHCPELSLRHIIPAGRVTWSYYIKLVSGISAGTVILNFYRKVIDGNSYGYADVIKLAIEKARYVFNPLQYRNYKRNIGEGNSIQSSYEVSRAVFKQCRYLLLRPWKVAALKNQVNKLNSQAGSRS